MSRVVVVGTGVAGCTAGHRLRQDGHEVVLLEAEAHVGGRTRTVARDGFALDTGAVYLLSIYDRTQALLEELGMAGPAKRWSPPAGLWDGTDLHVVRYDALATFLRLKTLTIGDKLRLVTQGAAIMLRRGPDPYDTDSCAEYDRGETIDAWSRRTFGDRVHEYLVRPWIEPAFGVGSERLAVPFLLGVLRRALTTRFTVPAAGMGELAERLADGLDVRTGQPVDRVEIREDRVIVSGVWGALDADAVVMATPAPITAALLDGEIPPPAGDLLRDAPYSTMVHVTLSWRRDPLPDCPVDMALPVGPGAHPVVGLILHGRKNPDAVPVGGQAIDAYLDEETSLHVDDEEAVRLAVEAARAMLGFDVGPDDAEVFRWERALAIAPPGHYARMQRLLALVPDRVALAGDYLVHLGVETAVVTGERAARRISAAAVRDAVDKRAEAAP